MKRICVINGQYGVRSVRYQKTGLWWMVVIVDADVKLSIAVDVDVNHRQPRCGC